MRHAKPPSSPLLLRILSFDPCAATYDGKLALELRSIGRGLGTDPSTSKLDPQVQNIGLRLTDWRFSIPRHTGMPANGLTLPQPDLEASKTELVVDCAGLPHRQKTTYLFLESPRIRSLLAKEAGSSLATQDLRKDQRQHGGNESSNLNQTPDVPISHNKSSLRKKASQSKDTPEASQEHADLGGPRTLSGIGVSGLNGRANMKRLRDVRNSYLLNNSQDSVIDLILPSDSKDFAVLDEPLAKRGPRQPLNSTASLASLVEDTSFHRQPATTGASGYDMSIKAALTDISPRKQTKGSQATGNVDQKLVSEVANQMSTLKGVKETIPELQGTKDQLKEVLTMEELLNCLSVELGLLQWSDLVFNSEVVRFLKQRLNSQSN